jgi:hypothetical protein
MEETMKKAVLILVKTALIILLIFNQGCADKGTSPEEDKHPVNALAGAYTASTAEIKISVMSDIAQKAINPLNQGEGSLSVTGAENAALGYMIIVRESDFEVTRIYNQSPLYALIFPSWPVYYMDYLRGIGLPLFGTRFTKEENDSETVYIGSDPRKIAVNNETRVLTANHSLYIHETDTCFINGTLEPEQVDIPADEFTEIIELLIPLLGAGNLVLDADGTFMGNIIFQEINDSLSGTWEVLDESRIRFTAHVTNTAAEDTLTAEYTLENSIFTLSITEDMLALLGNDPDDFAELFEMIIGLKQNSLRGADISIRLTAVKNTAKTKAGIGRPAIVLDPRQSRGWLEKMALEIETIRKMYRTDDPISGSVRTQAPGCL